MKFSLRICVILFLITIPLYSQQNNSFTLADCIHVAVNNHPDLQTMQENLNIADANYKVARSSQKPVASLSVTTKQIEKDELDPEEIPIPGKDTIYGIVAGVSASYSIYDPGRSEEVSNSKRGVELARLTQINQYRNLIYSVKENYYSLMLAQKDLQLKKASLERYGIIYRKMQIYARAGQESQVEVSNWEVILANAQLDYERAVQEEYDRRSKLFLSMGIEDSEENEIVIESVETLPALKLSIDQLEVLAMNYSPEIVESEIDEDIKRRNVKIQKDRRKPSLTAFGSIGYKNEHVTDDEMPVEERFTGDKWTPSFVVGVKSAMPLYSGGAIPGGIDKSKAEYNKSRHERKNVILTVKSDVKDMYKRLEFLKKQIQISKRKIITSQSNLRIVERNYESGMSQAEDVLDATESLYDAEMVYNRARVDYILLVSSLANLVGVDEEYICQK